MLHTLLLAALSAASFSTAAPTWPTWPITITTTSNPPANSYVTGSNTNTAPNNNNDNNNNNINININSNIKIGNNNNNNNTSSGVNPYLGKTQYVNPAYAEKLEETIEAFLSSNDPVNAAKARTAQTTSTFVWIASTQNLPELDTAIEGARAAQKESNTPVILNVVLYDLPDRDCAGGESSGEFSSAENGLNLYKTTYVDPFAQKLMDATDLTFAVIIEPDALANAVTNDHVDFCVQARPVYFEGIAYAVAKLQASHIHSYIDIAHGGWLGTTENLPKAATGLTRVLSLAQNITRGARVRGFSTNVSNFNQYQSTFRPNWTIGSPSYDEYNFVQSLTPFLKNASLPTQFIIDQGRVALKDARPTQHLWCNVPAGYGMAPTSDTGCPLVDAIVWAKPGGDSDGECGDEFNGAKAPKAGVWFNEYAMTLVKHANPSLQPTFDNGYPTNPTNTSNTYNTTTTTTTTTTQENDDKDDDKNGNDDEEKNNAASTGGTDDYADERNYAASLFPGTTEEKKKLAAKLYPGTTDEKEEFATKLFPSTELRRRFRLARRS